jgi:hypothetical protein
VRLLLLLLLSPPSLSLSLALPKISGTRLLRLQLNSPPTDRPSVRPSVCPSDQPRRRQDLIRLIAAVWAAGCADDADAVFHLRPGSTSAAEAAVVTRQAAANWTGVLRLADDGRAFVPLFPCRLASPLPSPSSSWPPPPTTTLRPPLPPPAARSALLSLSRQPPHCHFRVQQRRPGRTGGRKEGRKEGRMEGGRGMATTRLFSQSS